MHVRLGIIAYFSSMSFVCLISALKFKVVSRHHVQRWLRNLDFVKSEDEDVCNISISDANLTHIR